jgi:hypothetical protein
MLRMGGFDVHSHVKWPYPKTRKCAGSKAWKYSSGWKNVRVAKAMATRMTRAIGIACCIKVAGSLITAKCQRGTLSAKNDGTVDLSRPAASEAARHCPFQQALRVPQVSHKRRIGQHSGVKKTFLELLSLIPVAIVLLSARYLSSRLARTVLQ